MVRTLVSRANSQAAPRARPPRTSVSQWAPRYSRETATTPMMTTAAAQAATLRAQEAVAVYGMPGGEAGPGDRLEQDSGGRAGPLDQFLDRVEGQIRAEVGGRQQSQGSPGAAA